MFDTKFLGTVQLVPDEVVIRLFEAHSPRCAVRAVTRQWRDLIDERFKVNHISPPGGRSFSVDFEINRNMAKHLYCAQFGGVNACEPGGISGRVTFLAWAPAYLRRSGSRHVRHELDENAACALWKCVMRVRDARSHGDENTDVRFGHLTVSEGTSSPPFGGDRKRQVIGKLTATEAEQLLQLIDYRKNTDARPTVECSLAMMAA